jgi:hypothetical protein
LLFLGPGAALAQPVDAEPLVCRALDFKQCQARPDCGWSERLTIGRPNAWGDRVCIGVCVRRRQVFPPGPIELRLMLRRAAGRAVD